MALSIFFSTRVTVCTFHADDLLFVKEIGIIRIDENGIERPPKCDMTMFRRNRSASPLLLAELVSVTQSAPPRSIKCLNQRLMFIPKETTFRALVLIMTSSATTLQLSEGRGLFQAVECYKTPPFPIINEVLKTGNKKIHPGQDD